MPYSGNYYSNLRRFRISKTTTSLAAGISSKIYCNIFGVPNEFELERIRVYTGDITLIAANNIDIKILSDAGKYRAAEASTAGSGEQYVIAGIDDIVSEPSPNTYWLYDDQFDPPILVRDDLCSNSMHLLISSDAALTDDAVFTIEVSGYSTPEIYTTTHTLGEARHANRLLKVLRNDVAADTWIDFGNPNNPDYNKRAAITPFVLATDYVYFGMEERFNGLWFNINSANSTDAITMTWEYWNGTAWAALTIRDNCTDDATSPIVFADSGIIEWDFPAAWKPATIDIAKVTTDPPYDYPGTYASKWIPRYWVRCNIDDVSTVPTFYWIRDKAPVI